ncbi:ABC transporter permease [Candidatus Oleimmundimicrobium sp.]|uniref:ABC transporter permease n=1 Tax=Candidatus Oleimmundimicrobium sp. TaxID=3060597 RepID=UPI002720C96C|nr:ABC transporter permease [Candidatus Oleimmundimicrobium sp.]MDO8886888.1 ABC transporter permease [Candidatus Oleimmundimicrobium sp.]
MRFKKTNLMYYVFSLMGGLLILFILLPLARSILAQSPAILIEEAGDKSVQEAIFNSISLAAVTATIAALFGVPLAYILARARFFGKSLVESIVDLPLAIPHTVAGILLLFVFGRYGMVGALFERFFSLRFVGTKLGIVVAMLFVSLPFMVNSAREGFESVDVRMEQVARTLGATPSEVFRRVSLPLAIRGVLTGWVLTWARAISEFGAVIILAYYPMTAPVKVYDVYSQLDLKHSSAVSVLLLVFCLIGFVVFRLLAYGGMGMGNKK